MINMEGGTSSHVLRYKEITFCVRESNSLKKIKSQIFTATTTATAAATTTTTTTTTTKALCRNYQNFSSFCVITVMTK